MRWWINSAILFTLLGALGPAAGQDAEDPCLQEFQAGPCRATKYVVKFDAATGSCVPAVYGGCRGNANRFSGITECETVCSKHLKTKFKVARSECADPPLLSDKSCMGIFPRFRYDVDTGRCEKYIYGGCNGSKNLYLTEFDCIHTCINPGLQPTSNLARAGIDSSDAAPEKIDESITFPGSSKAKDSGLGGELDVCSMPPILPGPLACFGMINKWTFSQSEGKCVPYTYGGCRDTPNLFDTEAACQERCLLVGGPDRSARVCSLPIQPGPCRGFLNAFGFNSVTGRCEKFTYGGCRGNENRFLTVEECVNSCGGNTPDVDLNCNGVKCDSRFIQFNQAKGCVPITKPGECCPSSWDCSTWENRLQHKDKCFAVSPNNPRGKLYNIDEPIETNFPNSCSGVGCFCGQGIDSEEASPVCAIVDCFFPSGEDRCVETFSDPNSCCPQKYACNEELDALPTCTVDGKTYRQGERYISKQDPCKICLACMPQNGTDFCHPVDCGYHNNAKLEQGCVPIFKDGKCCPDDWVCPIVEDLLDNTVVTDGKTTIKPADRCLLPVAPSKDCSNPGFRYFFDKASGSCSLIENCPDDSKNNFADEEECNQVCKNYITSATPRNLEEKEYFQPKDTKCEADVEIGKCRSRLRKYYYDVTTGKCNEFFYSGCQGGENMFDTLRDCASTCVSPSSMLRRKPAAFAADTNAEVDPCSLEKAEGGCKAFKPRYFYNKESATCEKFIYSGCLGNANNFADLKSCAAKCLPGHFIPDPLPEFQIPDHWTASEPLPELVTEPLPTLDLDNLPELVPEPLPELVPEPLPPFPGMIGVPGGFFPCVGCPTSGEVTEEHEAIAIDAVEQMEEVLFNLAIISEECYFAEMLEVLDVKTQVVAGTNYIFKIRLESKTGESCEEGKDVYVCENVKMFKPLPVNCDGDDCNQLTSEEEIVCNPELPTARNIDAGSSQNFVEKDACLQEKKIGPCKAAMPRFHFDQESKTCKQFLYGGCQGNDNNFVSQSACENKCSHLIQTPQARTAAATDESPNPVCNLPMDAGFCFALKPRYFYNSGTKSCQQFLYGGCRGNQNNFETEEECMSACDIARKRGPPRPRLLEPLEPLCKAGNETYAVGDIVRVDDNPCKACICSSPPEISCYEKACPAIAPFVRDPSCFIVKDDLGCCDQHVVCPEPDVPVLISDLNLDGALGEDSEFPLAGGFRAITVDSNVKKIAVTAAREHLVRVPAVTGAACEHAQLLEILSASSQVVAGTNYRFAMRLRGKLGPMCTDETFERYCKNITIYKPLPFACQNPDPLKCLQLTREDEIECFDSRDELLASY